LEIDMRIELSTIYAACNPGRPLCVGRIYSSTLEIIVRPQIGRILIEKRRIGDIRAAFPRLSRIFLSL